MIAIFAGLIIFPALFAMGQSPEYEISVAPNEPEGEPVDFLEQELAQDASLRASELTQRGRKKFGLSVHPRSIERALARQQKKGRVIAPPARKAKRRRRS